MSEQKIPLDKIEPNPDQPRRNFDPAYIANWLTRSKPKA